MLPAAAHICDIKFMLRCLMNNCSNNASPEGNTTTYTPEWTLDPIPEKACDPGKPDLLLNNCVRTETDTMCIIAIAFGIGTVCTRPNALDTIKRG